MLGSIFPRRGTTTTGRRCRWPGRIVVVVVMAVWIATTVVVRIEGLALLPSSRRAWLQHHVGPLVTTTAVVVAAVIGATAAPPVVMAATESTTTQDLIHEMAESLRKLQPIPGLIETEKWDEIRTILKTPPVNTLWNLGEGVNPVMNVIKATGNVELVELKDELAYSLQMTDQFVYANNFIAFQPGNGKLKVKEPQEAITKAMSQLELILHEVNTTITTTSD